MPEFAFALCVLIPVPVCSSRSQKLVLNMLDAHCIVHNKKQIEAGESECQGQQQPLSSYDFLYLPIDFK